MLSSFSFCFHLSNLPFLPPISLAFFTFSQVNKCRFVLELRAFFFKLFLLFTYSLAFLPSHFSFLVALCMQTTSFVVSHLWTNLELSFLGQRKHLRKYYCSNERIIKNKSSVPISCFIICISIGVLSLYGKRKKKQ